MDNELKNCDPLNRYLNLTTGKEECLPGVIISPPGYTQLLPEVPVKPKSNWINYALIGIAAYYIFKK